jgi:prephenate dehydrogenase
MRIYMSNVMQPETFKRIAIVGLGLIGGSLGLAIKRKFPDIEIVGVGRQVVINEAVSIKAIDRGFLKTEVEACVTDADLVFLCMPIATIIDMLPLVARSIKSGALVTDVGSTKRLIVDTANRCFSEDCYFLGAHPMAGTENRGIGSADPFLFENAVYVLTPTVNIPGRLVEAFKDIIGAIGARVVIMEPEQHDWVAAAVSHLPQLTAVTLMNLISRQENAELFLQLAAGGFRDMTRIASSPYPMWRDILETNQEKIVYFIDKMIDGLKEIRKKLVARKLSDEFEHASHRRATIPLNTKGFMHPHFDLGLNVEDKPGVIATIAVTLAKENINIKDIEVLKVREGEFGSLRISLETPEERDKASELLEGKGISTRII